MKFIDLHADTLKYTSLKGIDALMQNYQTQLDIQKLIDGEAMAQFLSVSMLSDDQFEALGRPVIEEWQYIEELESYLQYVLREYDNHISFGSNYDTLASIQMANKISVFLSLKDGRAIGEEIDNVERLYNMGFRSITVAGNEENSLAFPSSDQQTVMRKGLKTLGFEVVERMNDLGMLIDVTGLSDGGFYDVIETSQQPIVATHSSVRELTHDLSSLTDDMIKKIANSGGVVGLTFTGDFLSDLDGNKKVTLSYLKQQLDHIRNIGGADVIALGANFDGGSIESEFDGPDKMNRLFDLLWHQGWDYGTIEKLAFQNAMRVIRDVMK